MKNIYTFTYLRVSEGPKFYHGNFVDFYMQKSLGKAKNTFTSIYWLCLVDFLGVSTKLLIYFTEGYPIIHSEISKKINPIKIILRHPVMLI